MQMKRKKLAADKARSKGTTTRRLATSWTNAKLSLGSKDGKNEMELIKRLQNTQAQQQAYQQLETV